MPQQEKEAAWNKHLGQKVQGFQNHAQQAAESAGIVQQKMVQTMRIKKLSLLIYHNSYKKILT